MFKNSLKHFLSHTSQFDKIKILYYKPQCRRRVYGPYGVGAFIVAILFIIYMK